MAVKHQHGNKISKRIFSLNFGVMILILAVIIVLAAITITEATRSASVRLAYIHSEASVGNFMVYASGDLALLRNAANSETVREWFADEENQEKRQAAFESLINYAASLQSTAFYLGIVDSLNEYSIDLTTTIEEFLPYGRMYANEPMDAWFFDLLDSDNDFLFNIDVDKIDHRWRIWINYEVVHDGRTVGVLCTSLRIDDILHSMFGKFDESYIRGYVIDNMGYIHIGTDALEHFAYWEDELIHISSIDTGLGAYVYDFVNVQGRFFTDESQTEIFRLSDGAFSFASVAPIANSDWMVVALFHDGALFDIIDMLPFAVAAIAALILYMIISTVVTRRYVLNPLANLKESVAPSTGASDVADEINIYGVDRDDEIGVLARNIHQAHRTLLNRERLLKAGNQAAKALLTTNESDSLDALINGMEVMGRFMELDRVSIWQHEKIDGELCFVLQYEWLSELGKQKKCYPDGFAFPYSSDPEFFDILLDGRNINGLSSEQTPAIQAHFKEYSVVSIAILPMFLNDELSGFLSLQDCTMERTFTKDETNVMASVGLMFTSVFIRSRQRKLAYTDALSGLYNRRYFMEMAERELQNCIEENRDFSVIMADIDNFKSMNDHHGHISGDEIIRIFSARIRHVLKKDTLLARYGGEEFVVTLTDVDHANAIKTAWRLNKAIKDSPFRIDDLEIKVTASFGVASKTDECATLTALINNADKALYQAKDAGRNTVVGFNDTA